MKTKVEIEKAVRVEIANRLVERNPAGRSLGGIRLAVRLDRGVVTDCLRVTATVRGDRAAVVDRVKLAVPVAADLGTVVDLLWVSIRRARWSWAADAVIS